MFIRLTHLWDQLESCALSRGRKFPDPNLTPPVIASKLTSMLTQQTKRYSWKLGAIDAESASNSLFFIRKICDFCVFKLDDAVKAMLM